MKRLTDYLVQLACSADAAPHVARGLIRNGRIWATGAQIAMIIADRLRKGRTDPAACPGVRGFTDEDYGGPRPDRRQRPESSRRSARAAQALKVRCAGSLNPLREQILDIIGTLV